MRGLFLAAPIVVHLGLAGAGNGLWLAIGLFFTLSGFLITTLALAEIDRTGRLAVGAFWARRFRRLAPASLLVLAGIVVAAWALDWPAMDAVGDDVRAALVWMANWDQLRDGGYWAGFTPSLTLHFWSLSLEEQVYVVLPLLVALGVVLRRRFRPAASVAVLSSAVISASWIVLWSSDDAAYLYLATWTRMGEVAVGCLAAAAVVLLGNRTAPIRKVDAVVLAIVVLEIPVWILARGDTAGGIRLGIMSSTPAVGLVVALLWTHPASRAARLFSLAPIAWLGRRSYGIYLLHIPMFDLLAHRLGVDHLRGVWMVAAVVATIGLAGLMFRTIEEPIRTRTMLRDPGRFTVAMMGMGTTVVVLSIVGAQFGRTGLQLPEDVTAPLEPSATSPRPPDASPPISGPGSPSDSEPTQSQPTAGEGTQPGSASGFPIPPGNLLLIGDSTAWVLTAAVRDAGEPLGFVTEEVHMVGCPPGGDARIKTSYYGGQVVVRDIGEDPGCDEWFDESLPSWLSDRQPSMVLFVGGYGLAYEVDPANDGRFCRLADGSGRCETWAADRLARITDRVLTYAPNTKMVWATTGHIDPFGPLEMPPAAIDELNDLIRAEADRSRASVIDLGPWIDAHIDLTVDGTHLGPDGVEALTPWMSTELEATVLGRRLSVTP
jgi:peptidoglycan/LPS O-acetylase OafA/YrhL